MLLVTRRGTLLMETGMLYDYFWKFSTQDERYYFHTKWNWIHARWDWNEHWKTWKLRKTQISFLGGRDLWLGWYLVVWGQEVQMGWCKWEQEGQWQGARWDRAIGVRSGRWLGGRDGRGQKGQMAVAGGGRAEGWWGRRTRWQEVVGQEGDSRAGIQWWGRGRGARRARWQGGGMAGCM